MPFARGQKVKWIDEDGCHRIGFIVESPEIHMEDGEPMHGVSLVQELLKGDELSILLDSVEDNFLCEVMR